MDLIYIDDCWYRFRVPYGEEMFSPMREDGKWVRNSCETNDIINGLTTFEYMEDTKNRVALRGNPGIFLPGWLMNSSLHLNGFFAVVDRLGYADCEFKSITFGVRPVFNLFTNL